MTIDPEDPCLLLYTFPAWQKIEAKIQELPSFLPATRRIQRLLVGHAMNLKMDGNRRVVLPALLREYAGLQSTAILVGQGNKFEIWDEERWNTHRALWLEAGMKPAGEGGLPPELLSFSL